jgi:nicotinamide-nucleotide adenylyltransferase
MIETGVIHGRFQVLHNDHMKYLLAGKEQCSQLVVGVTNPDPTLSREDPADPSRSLPRENPLTYFERYTLIKVALLEKGLSLSEISIVPFPINLPDLYKYYLPLEGTFFLTIYDEWGKTKRKLFHDLRLKTKVLWEKPIQEKGLRASEIRRRMATGKPWERLVPPGPRDLMMKWRIPERLSRLYDK